MNPQIATRQVGNVAVLDFGGRMTVDGGTALLRERIRELAAGGHKCVVFNMRELTYLDSAGMGEMVDACTTLRKLGGDLKLASPQDRVANLLRLTKLSSLFSIFPDEAAAIASF